MKFHFPLTACIIALLLLAGCSAPEGRDADLPLAEKALAAQNIPDAEMYFERYLRTHPEGAERWQVWNRLLDIALNRRQEKSTARDYLEIMLVEFSGQGERRRGIQMSLAALCSDMHLYPRAVALWETLAVDKELSPKDKAGVYRELARAYLHRLEFSLAADVLQACLELQVDGAVRADCQYDMADELMLTENQRKAETALRSLLQANEATPERRVLAVFMLADVLEQREKYAEAKELFESIRESYPNAKVIDLRIQFLNKRLK